MSLRPTFFLLLLISFAACKKDEPLQSVYKGFPVEVGKIFIDDCASSGCHTDTRLDQEGLVSLASWESLFRGGRNGAAVIPYRPDMSFLMYFINRDSAAGPVQAADLPEHQPALDTAAVAAIRDWIATGAPDIDGNTRFAGNPDRRKIYTANQGCDQVTVIDRGTRLLMDVVDIGQIPGFSESPHMIRISPDGDYWYVIFLAFNTTIEKYRASDDSFVGSIEIGSGDWNTISITPDGRYAFCVAYASRKIQVADLENMVALPNAIVTPEKVHGSAVHPDNNSVYVTQQDRSRLYKLTFSDPMNPDGLEEICLTPGCAPAIPELHPYEVAFTPDGARYLVACQGTREVRILQTSNDSLLATFSVGDFPSEIAFDSQTGLAFVTCAEDVTTFASDPAKRGSVAVIDYQNLNLVSSIYSGYQPHGLEVDEEARLVYVANRNAIPSGPAPHHVTPCGGRNGYITVIDINTLELLDEQIELSVDPYSVGLR